MRVSLSLLYIFFLWFGKGLLNCPILTPCPSLRFIEQNVPLANEKTFVTPTFANSKQRPSAFENQTKMANYFWLPRLTDCHLNFLTITVLQESMKGWKQVSQNISVSFNKHICNVFYCKHLDGSSWNIKSCCLLCPPYWKQTDSVSFGKQTFQNRRNETF